MAKKDKDLIEELEEESIQTSDTSLEVGEVQDHEDRVTVEHEAEREERVKPLPLPEDQDYVLTSKKRMRIQGKEFEPGETIGAVTMRYGLSPRIVFEQVGRLYNCQKVKGE